MKTLAPSYYPYFSCIAGDCRHTCCAGWEIDIDADTRAYYRSVGGAIGERLENAIEEDAEGNAYFRLCGEEEHCPFLNRGNLCDLILSLGEEALCDICAEHPRYYNVFSDRTETGIGLCCEAAAKLVLSWEEPVRLVVVDDDGFDDVLPPTAEGASCLALRGQVIDILQDRTKPVPARIREMLSLCGAFPVIPDAGMWAAYLSGLEILDPAWQKMLGTLTAAEDVLPEVTAEQFLVYLVYRHFPKMTEGVSARALAGFAAAAYAVINALYAVSESRNPETLWELVRLFSAEIEYSEENLCAVLELALRT